MSFDLACRRDASRESRGAKIGQEGEDEAMAYKFEVYKDKAGEFRFRFIASNGEKMFGSEGYKAKASAMKAIESIKKNVPEATVEDDTKES